MLSLSPRPPQLQPRPTSERRLTPARSLEQFTADPVGRALLAPACVIACPAPELQVAIVWGTLDDLALRELVLATRFAAALGPARRRVLVDLREVRRVDAAALHDAAALAGRDAEAWARNLDRHALLVPGGVDGLVLAGALPALGATRPLRATRDVDAAYAFVADPRAAGCHAEALALAGEVRRVDGRLLKLRALLDRHVDEPSVERVALLMGVSPRSLQRELQRLGTSFRAEVRDARRRAHADAMPARRAA